MKNNGDEIKWNTQLHEKWVKEREEEEQKRKLGRFSPRIKNCFERWKRKVKRVFKQNKGTATKVEIEALFKELEESLRFIVGNSNAMKPWLDQTLTLMREKCDSLFPEPSGDEGALPGPRR